MVQLAVSGMLTTMKRYWKDGRELYIDQKNCR